VSELVDESWYEPDAERWPRDTKVDEAKDVLVRWFDEHRERVFYGRQLAVLFEKRFFHWITTKAVNELATEKKVRSETLPLEVEGGGEEVRFYWSPTLRYWRRQALRIRELIQEFSRPELTRALGLHAELLFDAALARVGFFPSAQDVRAYAGREWTKTGHDLDRLYERDKVVYGAEIKNGLGYIEQEELTIKLEMCEVLGVRPLFIMRMAAKSYVEQVRQRGGFTLLFGWQLYPYGHESLAKRVREELGLPVDCPRAISEGTVKRFLDWHVKQRGQGAA